MLLYTSEFTLFENEYPELDEDITNRAKKEMFSSTKRITLTRKNSLIEFVLINFLSKQYFAGAYS